MAATKKAAKQAGPGWIDVDNPPPAGRTYHLGAKHGYVAFEGIDRDGEIRFTTGGSEDKKQPPWLSDVATVEQWNAKWGRDPKITFTDPQVTAEAKKKERRPGKKRAAKKSPRRPGAEDTAEAGDGWISAGKPPPAGRVYHLKGGESDADSVEFVEIIGGLMVYAKLVRGGGPLVNMKTGDDYTVDEWNDAWGRDPQVTFRDPPVAEDTAPEVRGLKPDLVAAATAPASHASTPPKANLVMVPIASIDASHNIRTESEPEGLLDLQHSIEDVGLLQPVVVRKVGKAYRMVSGRRRLRAAKGAGEDLIEAKVYTDVDDVWEAKARLAENIQRLELDHIGQAAEFGQAAERGLTVAEICEAAHVSDDTVRRHLSLRRLTKPVADLVASGRLPVHHGALIARVGDVGKQIELAREVLRLQWDNNGGGWLPKPGYGGGKYNPDGDATDRDYVMAMPGLRERVGQVMQGLAACGWPMAEDYAEKRACEGCEDNSKTHADQPMLFANIKPRGSDKKGFCTNGECYAAKAAAWEKVKEQRRKDKKKKIAKAIKDARTLGVKVCEECGIVGDVEKVGGRTLCAKHAKKAKGRSAAGGGESYDQREKRIKALKRRFPETADQKLAVALFDHGAQLAETIGKGIADGSIGDKGNCMDAASLVLWAQGWDQWETGRQPKAVPLEQVLHDEFPHGELAMRWKRELGGVTRKHRPRIGYHGEVECMPLDKKALAWIADIETLAKACELVVPRRPTAESMARAVVTETIVKGPRADAEKAIAACRDSGLIEEILAKAEAKTLKPKLAKWRDAALIQRLGALKGFAGDPRPMRREWAEAFKSAAAKAEKAETVAPPRPAGAATRTEDPTVGLTPEAIETAPQSVLAAECKRLGLSRRGNVKALRTRLEGERSRLGLPVA